MSDKVENEAEPTWQDISPGVDEALAGLPEEVREPLVLHYLEGRTQADISLELGVNQSTVSRRLEKGVDELRERLKMAGVVVPVALLAVLLGENAAAGVVPATLTAALGKMALAGVGPGASAPDVGPARGAGRRRLPVRLPAPCPARQTGAAARPSACGRNPPAQAGTRTGARPVLAS